MQWLQLTAKGFRDALSLECTYGRMGDVGSEHSRWNSQTNKPHEAVIFQREHTVHGCIPPLPRNVESRCGHLSLHSKHSPCRRAQSLSAFASPCVPLLLLALCMPLEALQHGAGAEPKGYRGLWGLAEATLLPCCQSLRRQLGTETADGALHRGSFQLHGSAQLPPRGWRPE